MDYEQPANAEILLINTVPDEIAKMILDHIKDSTDEASVSRASTVCARILLPSKPTWLFHEVVSHLAPYLSKVDLLNCCRACPKWQKGICQYLENCTNLKVLEKFAFAPKTTTALMGFCCAMKKHPGNPFLGRCVDFRKVNGGRFTTGYWIHVFQFLSTFGEHIWTCYFDFSHARLDLFVIILRQCLSRLKNVKRLAINWKFDNISISEEQMRTDLETPRFPPLKKLEHLELSGVFSRLFHEKVVLPMYSPQLKTLKADGIFA